MSKSLQVLIRDSDTRLLWSSETGKYQARDAVMQTDGNFVIYDHDATPVWSSATERNFGAFLALQNDGNMVKISFASSKIIFAVNNYLAALHYIKLAHFAIQ